MKRKLTIEKLAETLKQVIEEIESTGYQLPSEYEKLAAYKSILYRIENDIV